MESQRLADNFMVSLPDGGRYGVWSFATLGEPGTFSLTTDALGDAGVGLSSEGSLTLTLQGAGAFSAGNDYVIYHFDEPSVTIPVVATPSSPDDGEHGDEVGPDTGESDQDTPDHGTDDGGDDENVGQDEPEDGDGPTGGNRPQNGDPTEDGDSSVAMTDSEATSDDGASATVLPATLDPTGLTGTALLGLGGASALLASRMSRRRR